MSPANVEEYLNSLVIKLTTLMEKQQSRVAHNRAPGYLTFSMTNSNVQATSKLLPSSPSLPSSAMSLSSPPPSSTSSASYSSSRRYPPGSDSWSFSRDSSITFFDQLAYCYPVVWRFFCDDAIMKEDNEERGWEDLMISEEDLSILTHSPLPSGRDMVKVSCKD